METLKAKSIETDDLQTIKDYSCHPRLLYPAKLRIPIDEESKTFHKNVVISIHKSNLRGNSNLKKLNILIKTQPNPVFYLSVARTNVYEKRPCVLCPPSIKSIPVFITNSSSLGLKHKQCFPVNRTHFLMETFFSKFYCV